LEWRSVKLEDGKQQGRIENKIVQVGKVKILKKKCGNPNLEKKVWLVCSQIKEGVIYM